MTFSTPGTNPDLGAEPSQETDGHSIMAKLRLETSAAHVSIEQSPHMRALFEADYSFDNYRILLRRLLEFYVPFEASIYENLPTQLATRLDHRRKSHLLRADLGAISDVTDVRPAAVPVFHSDEERMGGLYVVEGATLGGRLIRKRLLDHFGAAVEPALSFYAGYGKRAAAEWRAFGSLLGGLFDQATEAKRDKVIAGANATFSALEQWLAQEEPVAELV